MADTKISGLTGVTTPADADELAVNQAGASKKVTLNQLTAYFEQRGRQTNASVANQTLGGATDTYITGSDVTIPAGRLQATSMSTTPSSATADWTANVSVARDVSEVVPAVPIRIWQTSEAVPATEVLSSQIRSR